MLKITIANDVVCIYGGSGDLGALEVRKGGRLVN